MKVIKGLRLKIAGLLSVVGIMTACGDVDATKDAANAVHSQSVTKQLEKMGRLNKLHSSTPAVTGGSCGTRPGGGEY